MLKGSGWWVVGGLPDFDVMAVGRSLCLKEGWGNAWVTSLVGWVPFV